MKFSLLSVMILLVSMGNIIVVLKILSLLINTDTDDWNAVVIELKMLSAHWEQLSIHLGLTMHVIDCIRKDHPNDSDGCLNEALSEWIKQNYSTDKFGLPSWRTLFKAVKPVNNSLFKKLAPKHQLASMQLCMHLYCL